MSLIRLLDISGILHPIWRAKEAAGRPPGEASDETVRTLRERAAAGDVDHVVACCDAPGRTFRHDIAEEYKQHVPEYRGYKGHRPERDAAMMFAIDRVIDELEQDGVPIFRVPGFEADDVIATITHWATAQGHSVEIISDDKDLLSLVVDADPDDDTAPSVVVVRRDGTMQDSRACIERLGVPPHLVPAYLAMSGDKSDGVIGVRDVGGTWAVRLLWGRFDEARQWRPTPFKSFNDVVAAAADDQAAVEASEREREDARARRVRPLPPEYRAKFPKDVRQSLLSNAPLFAIGLRLTRLRTDVPLDVAAVTAPRVPKPKPQTDAWNDQRAKAAEIDAAIAEEEEEEMSQTVIEMPQTSPAPVTAEPPPCAEVQAMPATSAPSVAPGATAMVVHKTNSRAPRDFLMELEPRTYNEAMLVAEHLSESKLFKEIVTPPQAMALILLGRKFGLSAVDSLRMIHMIEGKPTMSAQLIIGIVQKSGFAEYFELDEASNTGATWITKRRGARREKSWTFTVDDAKTARLGGLWDKEKKVLRETFDPNSNWAKHPKVMCMWRAAVFLARAVYTDLVGGLYMPEELREADVEIDGNPPMLGELGQTT